MNKLELDKEIETIMNNGDSESKLVLRAGMEGLWGTPEKRLKGIYELGLEKFLRGNRLRGVYAYELSRKNILKGFILTLERNGRGIGRMFDEKNPRKCAKRAEKAINLFVEQCVNEEASREELDEFVRGEKLAGRCLDIERYLEFLEIDPEGIPNGKLKRYSEYFKDLGIFIEAGIVKKRRCRETAINLYKEKQDLSKLFLLRGELFKALETCDYLEVIIRYAQRLDMLNETYLTGTYPAGEMENLREQRRKIARRLNDDKFNLEERMRDLAATGHYEGAAAIRDKLRKDYK